MWKIYSAMLYYAMLCKIRNIDIELIISPSQTTYNRCKLFWLHVWTPGKNTHEQHDVLHFAHARTSGSLSQPRADKRLFLIGSPSTKPLPHAT